MSNQKPNSRHHEKKPDAAPGESVTLEKISATNTGANIWWIKRQKKQVKTDADRARDQEDARATVWEMLPLIPKKVVMMAAGLPQARARDSLTAFTPVERIQIAMAVDAFTTHLNLAVECMKKNVVH